MQHIRTLLVSTATTVALLAAALVNSVDARAELVSDSIRQDSTTPRIAQHYYDRVTYMKSILERDTSELERVESELVAARAAASRAAAAAEHAVSMLDGSRERKRSYRDLARDARRAWDRVKDLEKAIGRKALDIERASARVALAEQRIENAIAAERRRAQQRERDRDNTARRVEAALVSPVDAGAESVSDSMQQDPTAPRIAQRYFDSVKYQKLILERDVSELKSIKAELVAAQAAASTAATAAEHAKSMLDGSRERRRSHRDLARDAKRAWDHVKYLENAIGRKELDIERTRARVASAEQRIENAIQNSVAMEQSKIAAERRRAQQLERDRENAARRAEAARVEKERAAAQKAALDQLFTAARNKAYEDERLARFQRAELIEAFRAGDWSLLSEDPSGVLLYTNKLMETLQSDQAMWRLGPEIESMLDPQLPMFLAGRLSTSAGALETVGNTALKSFLDSLKAAGEHRKANPGRLDPYGEIAAMNRARIEGMTPLSILAAQAIHDAKTLSTIAGTDFELFAEIYNGIRNWAYRH